MHFVYAADAEAVRRLVPRLNRLFDHPYCAYLVVLAREIDHEAIRFLDQYRQAIHDETAEAIAVIVLFDDIRVRGKFGNMPGISVITDDRISYGEFPRTVRELPSDSGNTIYRASPRWSVKFADEIGLSRSFVPCIVGIDHRASLGDDEDTITVVDLSDADQGWQIIRDAVASFMELQASREFVLGVEKIRALKQQRASMEDAAKSAAAKAKDRHSLIVGRSPMELLQLIVDTTDPDRRVIMATIDAVSRMTTRNAQRAAAVLAAVTSDLARSRALLNYEQCADHLTHHWISTDIALGHAQSQVIKHLEEALRVLGRNTSPQAIDELLLLDEHARQSVVETVRDEGAAQLREIITALSALRIMRPSAKKVHYDLTLEEGNNLAKIDNQIHSVTWSLKPVPFTPHLLRAIDSNNHDQLDVNRGERWRTLARRSSGVAGFGTNVVQIFKNLGIIP